MKLKNLNNLSYKLIKFEFIKNKIVSNYFSKFQFNEQLNKIEIFFKKALFLIFQYHISNKKILFIGIPNEISQKLKRKHLKHVFLPKEYWIKGLLTNKITIYKYIKSNITDINKDNLENYFLLKQKPDLIVLFDVYSFETILRESGKLNIPLINFNSNIIFGYKNLYTVEGNFKHLLKNKNNFLFLIIKSVLKNNPTNKQY